jgi:hypothetical protein
VYPWVEEDNGESTSPSMEPETAAVLRKDMAGCVAVGVVQCRRYVSVRSERRRRCEIH